MTDEMTTRDPEYLCAYRSTVREEYGLTEAMIDELGPPDEWAVNPHYRCGPLASLYLRSRVEAWVAANAERVEKAREHRAKCRARSAVRRAAKEEAREQDRQERVLRQGEWLDQQTIVVQPLPPSLLSDARRAFPGDGLTDRQLVAYVRDNLTNFTALREQVRALADGRDLYPRLRERADAAVRRALAARPVG